MTTTISPPLVAPPLTPGHARGVHRALGVIGLVLLTTGVVLGPLMMFDSRPYSELSATSQHLLHYALWTGCLVALSQVYPRLAGLGRTADRRVTTAAATAAAVGVVLDACGRFILAFVNPFLADHAPELLDTAPDPILLVPVLGGSVLAMVGTIWLAASGWRAGVFPRPAVVLLIVGAVAMPAVGPLSNVMIGAGLAWIGFSLARRP